MEQEIAHRAKSLKKEEIARISKLVERSMALDMGLGEGEGTVQGREGG